MSEMPNQNYAATVAEIDLTTADGTMNCHVITPERDGTLRAVIVYMPASGIRPELVGIAERIAAMGYVVVLPNSFYRLARHVDIDANRLGDDDYLPVREFMIELAGNITNPRIIADTGVILSWLERQDGIDAGRIGGVGYCMGGRLVMAAAGAYPDRFAAAASLYGAGIVTDEGDSPHLKLGDVSGELYFGVAENDIYVSEEETAALKAHLPTIDVQHTVETYPGTEHGFVFPERYCFSPEGAELHYERLADLFDRNLS
ncbi:MAG: dienelactone hydrolase family protein [Acidimicrobiales bacterium]|nr:dienelactone hydrolase family protein [Acidimicrobiaceae bacterium]MXY03491.1 dienelactone hydrolase family protein [Acidimicrobiales bacterium]MDE0134197.1 dienelactone hydrolase family protein [Acidimicrobiaceae bacterium]MDE0676410.1 dienelactone hydrolase family protein [Acidimicrobiaceae bacterium]MYG87711.1 dienelactone hydrolase family protein [Acidimicrobiales bacterium]